MRKFLSALLSCTILFTLAACSSASSSVAEGPVADAVIIQEDEVPEVVLNQAVLTGREKTGTEHRITAVMVNNIAPSRPTRGLSEAQMLVEIVTEGGITRFMALYENYEAIPEVGPVRSARDQFFQLILPMRAFYLHEGESTVQKQYFIDWEYGDYNLDIGIYGAADYISDPTQTSLLAWRDANRAGYSTEYTRYSDGDHITGVINENSLPDVEYNSTMFHFVPYTEEPRVPVDGMQNSIGIVHSASYRTLFDYDAASGRYMMSQYNSSKNIVEDTVDENNGVHLGFENVLVLFAPMSLYPNSELVHVDYTGGAGYYFSNGGYEMVIWAKGGPDTALQLYKGDKSGEPVFMNPGTTYLGVVNDNNLEDFYNVLQTGDTSAAADGEMNTGEVDTD